MTVVISIMKLPEIIAKYLFSSTEEENTISIVKYIQDYDIEMFQLQNKMDSSVMGYKPRQILKEFPDEKIKLKIPNGENQNNTKKVK